MLCNEHKAELETKIDTITGVYKTFDFFFCTPKLYIWIRWSTWSIYNVCNVFAGSWLWLSASIIDSSRPRKMARLDVGIYRLCTGMYSKTFELLIKRRVASKGLQCGSQKRQTQLQIIWRVLSALMAFKETSVRNLDV